MNLPYDVARCSGTGHWLCQSCRRTEPGDPARQWVTYPLIVGDSCANYYPQIIVIDRENQLDKSGG